MSRAAARTCLAARKAVYVGEECVLTDFEQLLARSYDFSQFLVGEIDSAGEFASGERPEAAAAAADLVFEHAHALRVLFEAGTPSSAAALLRPQYESLLRAAWILYAAPDAQVSKLTAPLTRQSAAAAKNIAGADEMLQGLERRLEHAPQLRGLVQPLREIRDEAWAAMNGFVHAGLHPLARTKDGFPVQLATAVVKMSNGMVHMAGRLLARFTNDEKLVLRIERSYVGFEDVLPVVTPPAAG